MNNNPETKLCRHCRSEMAIKATVCPNCHKSQRRGKGCIIALIIADMELIIKGPVISINHSVSDSEKKYYHRCLIGILAVFNIIIIAATVLHLYRTASCISIVIIFCFISHIACMTEKNRKLYY